MLSHRLRFITIEQVFSLILMERTFTPRSIIGSSALARFLEREATLAPRKVLTVAATAGLGNAMILAIINAAAEHAEQSQTRPMYAVFFVVTMIVYVIAQRWILIQAAEQIEAIIHKVRMRIVRQLQHCELLDVEHLGHGVIYSGIARHMQTLSQSASTLTIALQMGILIIFATAYIAYLSLISFVTLAVFMAIALSIYWRKSFSVKNDLRSTLEMDNNVYTVINDLLNGFKESKLNRAKARAIILRIDEISSKASLMRSNTQILLAQNFVFSQTTFNLLLGTMVFVVPMLTSGYSDVVQKSTTAVLFIIGPIAGLVGSIPIFENASTSAEAIMELEERLETLSGIHESKEPISEVNDGELHATPFSNFKTIELREAIFRYDSPSGDPRDSFSIGPIDLLVKRGETLFITGGNGSGKSTLLKVFTGLYPLRSGRILVDGKRLDSKKVQDYRELFSAVFGDFYLFSHLYGISNEALSEADDLIELLEIHHKVHLEGLDFSTIDLSSGQRKRLALLSAMLEHRPILVLDEWAADQDPMFRRKFYREILDRLRSFGVTVVAVTHDNRFFDAADRQMHMEDGLIGAYNSEYFHD
jgi:putative pyoverdin transport system ATP-binding/permease protein